MGGDEIRAWATMLETRVERTKVIGEGVVAEMALCSVWETEEKGQYISVSTETERRPNLQERQPFYLRSSYMFLEDSQVEMLGDQRGLGI